MWQKTTAIVIGFYILALLQNSFFAYFNILGAVPNLVFALFFCFAFFSSPAKFFSGVIPLAFLSGFLLDFFSSTLLGASVVLLIIIGFLVKRTQLLLKEGRDSYPFVYFVVLFLAYFVLYQVLFMLYLRFIDPMHISLIFDIKFLIATIYSLVFSIIGFWGFKNNVRKI